jgi:NADH-quinone oxidoreductase subunit C
MNEQTNPAAGKGIAAGQPNQATGNTPVAGQPSQATGNTPVAGQPNQATGNTPVAGQPSQATGNTPAAGQPSQATGNTPVAGQPNQRTITGQYGAYDLRQLPADLASRYGAHSWHNQRPDLSVVSINPGQLRDALTWLRDQAGYVHLSFATAVDNIEHGVFTLTYALRNHAVNHAINHAVSPSAGHTTLHSAGQATVYSAGQAALNSTGQAAAHPVATGTSGHSLLVHADVDRSRPVVDSIHLLWGQAWTYQREMKEWYGIDFPGSPRVDEEFVLEGWEGPPMMRRDFDSLAYSDATYAERPGRTSHDPAVYMKKSLYPEPEAQS